MIEELKTFLKEIENTEEEQSVIQAMIDYAKREHL